MGDLPSDSQPWWTTGFNGPLPSPLMCGHLCPRQFYTNLKTIHVHKLDPNILSPSPSLISASLHGRVWTIVPMSHRFSTCFHKAQDQRCRQYTEHSSKDHGTVQLTLKRATNFTHMSLSDFEVTGGNQHTAQTVIPTHRFNPPRPTRCDLNLGVCTDKLHCSIAP